MIDIRRVDEEAAAALASNLLEAGTARRVRIMARLLAQERVSGQELASDLSMSRAGIHKHVEYLRSHGISIASVPGAGYVIDSPEDSLIPEAVLPHVFNRWADSSDPPSTTRLGLPYTYLDRTESTNEVLKRQALGGAPAGAFVVTDDQHLGKGRLGRTWVSDPGKDLTFSMLLRPDRAPRALRPLIFAVTLGVADALASLDGLAGRVSVKWPNDVLLDGGKVSGTLGDISLDMDEVHWMVLGVGVNVNGVPRLSVQKEGDPFVAFPPVSIREAAGGRVSRTDLLPRSLATIEARLAQCERGEDRAVLEDFQRLDALLGRRVRVEYGGGSMRQSAQGTAAGIGDGGEFLVRLDSGDIRRFEFGEASPSPDEDLGRMRPPADL